jgi:uncharacterized protein (TIGR03437 family)
MNFERVLLLLLVANGLRGETPLIASITNYAAGDARFSPGVLASLRYGYFTPYSGTVLIGGRAVEYRDQEDGSTITIQVPVDFPLGPTTVVLDNVQGKSQPFPITVDAYAPGIFVPTRSPDPYSLTLACNATASPGEMLNLFAVGLGAVDAGQTVGKLTVSVGGTAAQVIDASVTPSIFGRPGGIYRVRFVVPPGDGLHLVRVSIDGILSNIAPLPVGLAIQNYQSATFKAGPAAAESIMTAVSCSAGDFIEPGFC